MSFPRAALMRRALLLVALAGAAAVPASAHAFVQTCVYPTNSVWVCHAPELGPGCVYGSLGAEANFRTQACPQ